MFTHMQSFPHTKVRFLKMDNVLQKVHGLLVSDFTRALPKDNCLPDGVVAFTAVKESLSPTALFE